MTFLCLIFQEAKKRESNGILICIAFNTSGHFFFIALKAIFISLFWALCFHDLCLFSYSGLVFFIDFHFREISSLSRGLQPDCHHVINSGLNQADFFRSMSCNLSVFSCLASSFFVTLRKASAILKLLF